MKKIITAMAVLCFAANCSAVTPSQQKADREAMRPDDQGGGYTPSENILTWTGEIISIKRSLNQVTVEDQRTLSEKTFTAKPEDLKSFKLGDNVEIKYKITSDMAESITAAKAWQLSPGY